MTALNNKLREEFATNIITAAFKSRFEVLAERLRANALALNMQDHAPWYEARKDATLRQYLTYESTQSVLYKHPHWDRYEAARLPVLGTMYTEHPPTSYRDGTEIRCGNVPGSRSTTYKMTDAETAEYIALWEQYGEALRAVNTLLASYKTVEKFLADFPEYEAHSPIVPPKPQLPAVVPDEWRAKLSAVGVPKDA